VIKSGSESCIYIKNAPEVSASATITATTTTKTITTPSETTTKPNNNISLSKINSSSDSTASSSSSTKLIEISGPSSSSSSSSTSSNSSSSTSCSGVGSINRNQCTINDSNRHLQHSTSAYANINTQTTEYNNRTTMISTVMKARDEQTKNISLVICFIIQV
jgi:hypothetical protein